MTDETAKAILAEDRVQALKAASLSALKFIQEVIGQSSFNMSDGIRAEVRLVDALNQFTKIEGASE